MNAYKLDRKALDLNWEANSNGRDCYMQAIPGEATWTLWKAHKESMKECGFSIRKLLNGRWVIQWRDALDFDCMEDARSGLFEAIENNVEENFSHPLDGFSKS